jgi:hypothetical protein
VTGNVSNAIASLAKAWPGKNVTIGQAGVGMQHAVDQRLRHHGLGHAGGLWP